MEPDKRIRHPERRGMCPPREGLGNRRGGAFVGEHRDAGGQGRGRRQEFYRDGEHVVERDGRQALGHAHPGERHRKRDVQVQRGSQSHGGRPCRQYRGDRRKRSQERDKQGNPDGWERNRAGQRPVRQSATTRGSVGRLGGQQRQRGVGNLRDTPGVPERCGGIRLVHLEGSGDGHGEGRSARFVVRCGFGRLEGDVRVGVDLGRMLRCARRW